jgi:hypothetical protein
LHPLESAAFSRRTPISDISVTPKANIIGAPNSRDDTPAGLT